MRFFRVLAAAAMISGLSAACIGTTERGIVATNQATGEIREFDSPDQVPEGWLVCAADGTCPDPLPCGEIYESACLVRADCAPIYDDDAAYDGCVDSGVTCPEEACGPALGMPSFDCWDGSIGGSTGRCIAHGDGQCGWEVLECAPPPECTDEDCGPAPGMPNWECDDGSTGGPACVASSDGSCGWAILECPEDGTCDDAEKCGPPLGMPAYLCEDGSTGGNTGRCLDLGDGTCGWEIRECPEGGG